MNALLRRPPDRPDLLYLSTEGLPPTVLESQVGDHLQQMQAAGLRVHWLALIGLRDYRRDYAAQRTRLAALRARLGRVVDLCPFPYPSSERALPWLVYRVRQLVPGRAPFVVHARAHDACRLALGIKRASPAARVVFDVRGEAVGELEYEAGADARRDCAAAVAAVRALERRAVNGADAWLCVSESLRAHLCRLYPALTQRSMTVVPCAASTAKFGWDPTLRAETRRRLGIGIDTPTFIYVGQLIRYEMPAATVALVAAARRVWPHLHFIVVTPHTATARSLLAGVLPEEQCTIRSARHDEINAYLNAADVGLLIREAHLLNTVACPTKFGEYAVTGLAVVTTRGAGDCAYHVAAGGGIVLANPSDRERLLRELPVVVGDGAQRSWRAARGVERFARERYLSTYVHLYRWLLRGSVPGVLPDLPEETRA